MAVCCEPICRVEITGDNRHRCIRAKLGLTQSAFARRFGFNLATLRDWERGRYQPDAPARVLLLVIANRTDAVEEVLDALVERDGHACVEVHAAELVQAPVG